MEKISTFDEKDALNDKKSFIKRLKEVLNREKAVRASDKKALLYDLLLFAAGFILTRCHLIFGARPVGIAFVAMLPCGVWSALFGTVISALTLGTDGIILAAAGAIIVFLRVALAVGEKSFTEKIFQDALLIRVCISVLGGFVVALYEVVMNGLNETSLLFGLTMIISSPVLVFLLSGAFSLDIDIDTLAFGSDGILSLSNKGETERRDLIFFRISTLLFLFLLSLSLKGVDIFGISIPFVFSSLATLATAKRFGALSALTVGFITSFGISSSLAVSFALLGLAAGIMFGFGTGYALVAGGFALGAWSAYTGGLGGFISTLPEYVIASSVGIPLLKGIGKTKIESLDNGTQSTAEDMVGTMALAYQNNYSGSLNMLEMTLGSLASVVREYNSRGCEFVSEDEYRKIALETSEKYCARCQSGDLCAKENICPCAKNASKIASKLASGEKISREDVNCDTEFCQMADTIADDINREAAIKEAEYYRTKNSDMLADEYEMIAKLINYARTSDEAECQVDDSVTDALTEIFNRFGFENGTIRAFGERKRHLILAGEDGDGSKITSRELREEIEKALDIKLATPEYFRKDKTLLMKCDVRRKFAVKIATAESSGKHNEISGDTICAFESESDRFFSLISDGMGSGDIAKETSSFVAKFMQAALNAGAGKETLMHMLNHTLKSGREECSATVDLFELDLLTGEATFIKSGAAPSYVKREGSIFRIRSQTAPIGLLSSIDSEKIKVEVKSGDYVIMLSDGIADSMEDAPWLLLLLGDKPPESLDAFAEKILFSAKEHAKTSDDMSVIVMKIEEF